MAAFAGQINEEVVDYGQINVNGIMADTQQITNPKRVEI